ncbi:MAG: hypothetical protein QM736_10390 [Vicinamibacterales bacterium]
MARATTVTRRHRQADHAWREDLLDQHIHAVGEAVTGGSELGIWLYPKGQEPTKRSYLVAFTRLKNGTVGLYIPPNSGRRTRKASRCSSENTIITNFQPHFHLRGKAMSGRSDLP